MSSETTEDSARSRLVSTLAAMRPERIAGGFTRDDGTVQFYTRVNSLVSSSTIVLDYGAGRGRQFDVPDPGYTQVLQNFQGRVAKVIGVDVEPAVHDHPHLDECHVIQPGAVLPLPPGSVDVVVADWVLEHLDRPGDFAQEMERAVAPGGWVCARRRRTPCGPRARTRCHPESGCRQRAP